MDGNRVYVVGSRGEILCLDREGQANGNDGPFLGELAYMGITNTPDAKLEPTDGDILWKYNLITELGVILHDVCGSTLLLDGDLLYACTSNGIDDRHDKIPKPDAPSLIVLDKNSGQLVAKDDVENRSAHVALQLVLPCAWSRERTDAYLFRWRRRFPLRLRTALAKPRFRSPDSQAGLGLRLQSAGFSDARWPAGSLFQAQPEQPGWSE